MPIRFLLAASASCLCSRCVAVEPLETVNQGSPLPIWAWVGVPSNESTPQAYRELADAGFTLSYSGAPDPDAMTKMLMLLSKRASNCSSGFLNCKPIPRERPGSFSIIRQSEVIFSSTNRGRLPSLIWESGPSESKRLIRSTPVTSTFCRLTVPQAGERPTI